MDTNFKHCIASDGSNVGNAIAGAIRDAVLESAKKEYAYIAGIDWREPGSDFNYDSYCFLRYCEMQASGFLKFDETRLIGEDLTRFIAAARGIGYKGTGLSRAQCHNVLMHFAPYTRMEASKVIGSCSYEELNIELNHWLAVGGF